MSNRTITATLLLLLLVPATGQADRERSASPVPDEAPLEGATRSESYTVQSGDTLSGIARHLGVGVDMLLLHNPQLNPDRIRAGQTLQLGDERPRVDYRIQPGDTLSAIRARFRVSMEELRRWNVGLRPDRIRAGRELVIYSNTPLSTSQSVGTPSRGRLTEALPLPRHPGYEIRSRNRAWGTLETVTNVVEAFDWVRAADGRAPRVRVHDISTKLGGPMTDHRSHQSGRDVDMAYFYQGCGKTCSFRPVRGDDLDATRQWRLLEYWLKRDQVEAVFVDYRLQAPLYRAAKRDGATREQLNKWFQYPSGRTHPVGIIRHYPKHADHLHVRFHCHKSDPECKTFRPLLRRAER